ncbi:hypothetical protein J2W86_004162 [Delftia lacustris]|nr:hypothetical protein [Delftia lacustris]
MPLLSAAAPSSLIASTALPTPLPTIFAVPTAASAASPTAEAVTLTAVAVTATTVQPDSRAVAQRQRKAPRAGDREGLRDMDALLQWMRMPGVAPGKGSST